MQPIPFRECVVACQTENQAGMLESCASWSATCCALQAGQFINANHIRENRRIRCDRSQNSRCTASRRTDQPGGACFEGRPVGLADYIDDGLGSGDDGSAAQRSASPSINFRLDERVPKNHLLRGGGSRRHARAAPALLQRDRSAIG